MKITKTKLKDVLLIAPEVFEDHRGEYVEIYNKTFFDKNGVRVSFIQDDISVSTRRVLRGIHGDAKTWKLVSCLYGKFYLVVICNDKSSKQYGQWQSFVLSDKNRLQVLIPPRHGNGHLILSDQAIFHYKQTTDYDPRGQFTIKWNDPQFKIWWPVKNPILSQRDEEGRYV